MTPRQIKKLDTIIAKLEALEAELPHGSDRDHLHDAKNQLLRAYNNNR